MLFRSLSFIDGFRAAMLTASALALAASVAAGLLVEGKQRKDTIKEAPADVAAGQSSD